MPARDARRSAIPSQGPRPPRVHRPRSSGQVDPPRPRMLDGNGHDALDQSLEHDLARDGLQASRACRQEVELHLAEASAAPERNASSGWLRSRSTDLSERGPPLVTGAGLRPECPPVRIRLASGVEAAPRLQRRAPLRGRARPRWSCPARAEEELLGIERAVIRPGQLGGDDGHAKSVGSRPISSKPRAQPVVVSMQLHARSPAARSAVWRRSTRTLPLRRTYRTPAERCCPRAAWAQPRYRRTARPLAVDGSSRRTPAMTRPPGSSSWRTLATALGAAREGPRSAPVARAGPG